MSTNISIVIVVAIVIPVISLLVSQAYTGVPALSSNASEAADVIHLLKHARIPESATILDLGSGWGHLAISLAKAFSDAYVRGIELSPFPYLVARVRARNVKNVSFQWGDFERMELSADAVTSYLMPDSMARISRQLDAVLKQGTPVVSVTFWFRGRHVSVARQTKRRGAVALYYWPALTGAPL